MPLTPNPTDIRRTLDAAHDRATRLTDAALDGIAASDDYDETDKIIIMVTGATGPSGTALHGYQLPIAAAEVIADAIQHLQAISRSEDGPTIQLFTPGELS